jgi:hypothetical protein
MVPVERVAIHSDVQQGIKISPRLRWTMGMLGANRAIP